MEQVGWEFKGGVQSLMSLLSMMEEAIEGFANGVKAPRRSITWATTSARQGWVGIRF